MALFSHRAQFKITIGSNYWRRTFVRLPPYTSTPENRLETARALAHYLATHPKNNYKTPCTVDPLTFDHTPTSFEDRHAIDEYMMDSDIINFMGAHFEMPDSGAIHWARENAEIKDAYFSGPIYPDIAISRFGYTNNHAALAAAANPVAEDLSDSEDNSSDDDEAPLKSNASEENSSDDDVPVLRSNAHGKKMPPSMAKGIKK